MDEFIYDSSDTDRVHTFDGKEIPSATQALKLISDFSMIPKHYMKRGKYFHKLIENRVNGKVDNSILDEEDRGVIGNFETSIIALKMKLENCIAEKAFFSKKFSFCGKIDIIDPIAGIIADYKTSFESDSIYNEIQLIFYKQLVIENFPEIQKEWKLVNIYGPKNDICQSPKTYTKPRYDFNHCRTLLNVANMRHNILGKPYHELI